MRRDAVAVAITLYAVAATLLIFDRPWSDEGTPTASTIGAGRATTPSLASASVPSIADRSRIPPSPRVVEGSLVDDHSWKTFERLRARTDGAALWQARTIAFDCRLTALAFGSTAKILAGQPINRFERIGPRTRAVGADNEAGAMRVVQGPATPAQVEAARELRRRCGDFAPMTSADLLAIIAELDGRLSLRDDAFGLAFAISAHRLPPTPDRLATVLAMRDPAAITLLDEALVERWQRQGGMPVAPGLFGAPTPVMRLVACDLDSDCSASGRTALLGCIDDPDACGLDVHRQLMRLETPHVQQSIEQTRAAWLQAIGSGDYGIWGL